MAKVPCPFCDLIENDDVYHSMECESEYNMREKDNSILHKEKEKVL